MAKDISTHNTKVRGDQQKAPDGRAFGAEGNRQPPAGERGGLDSQPGKGKTDPKKWYGG